MTFMEEFAKFNELGLSLCRIRVAAEVSSVFSNLKASNEEIEDICEYVHDAYLDSYSYNVNEICNIVLRIIEEEYDNSISKFIEADIEYDEFAGDYDY